MIKFFSISFSNSLFANNKIFVHSIIYKTYKISLIHLNLKFLTHKLIKWKEK